MTKLLAGFALAASFAAASAAAETPADVIGRIAAGIGAPLPPETQAVVVPLAAPVEAAPAGQGVAVEGSGLVSGRGVAQCSEQGGGQGTLTGWVNLSGRIPVVGADGVAATVKVSGYVHLSGSCLRGMGRATGRGEIAGSSAVVKDGKKIGTIRISALVNVDTGVTVPFVSVSQTETFKGEFTPSPAAK